jgi:hypothetical protein
MFSIAKNTVAKAKLVYNKKLNTYKLLVAFNVTQRNKKGQLMFPVQQKCNYVSGDISAETLQKDLVRVLNNAEATLRTNNIVFED